MACAPPIGTTEMPSASRFRPRRSASASSARWSLIPSTSTTARTSTPSTPRIFAVRLPYDLLDEGSARAGVDVGGRRCGSRWAERTRPCDPGRCRRRASRNDGRGGVGQAGGVSLRPQRGAADVRYGPHRTAGDRGRGHLHAARAVGAGLLPEGRGHGSGGSGSASTLAQCSAPTRRSLPDRVTSPYLRARDKSGKLRRSSRDGVAAVSG